MTEPAGPLQDLRVVDLTRVLAGPYCTMLLADLGAEVIKVEPPQGDSSRTLGPYAEDDSLRAYGGYFQSINRNKRGIALDLKQESAREVVRRLVERSDALVENFRAGVMERLGLGYESLRERNSKLVYAAIRGFGDPRTGASPYVDWPAFDITSQAFGGFMGITGAGPGESFKAGPGIGDIFPAVLTAVGVLAAVHHSRRTGEGQFLDVGMYDGVLALCERIVHQHSYAGEVPHPQGNTHPLLSPFDTFRTRDGQVTIAAPEAWHWTALVEAMGRPELADDERFATNSARVLHRAEVEAMVAGWCAERTKAEVVEALGGQVPVAPVQSIADIVADPHVAARRLLAEVEQPGSSVARQVAAPAIKLTATPAAVRTRAPLLGEHSEAVLEEIGYGEGERADLFASGAVLRP
jgi:crotonobetainyl-CoA:carnitine CoA-transferase CaiB-like acyl-CoA transferase